MRRLLTVLYLSVGGATLLAVVSASKLRGEDNLMTRRHLP